MKSLINMTATEIFEHEEYYNILFSFPNEQWTPVRVKGFPEYMQSNCYRVKNIKHKFIVKPSEQINRRSLVYRLRDTNSKFKSVRVDRIFDNCDIQTQRMQNKGTDFLLGAF